MAQRPTPGVELVEDDCYRRTIEIEDGAGDIEVRLGLDFNRLMGVYIAIFFLVSQVISFILFKQIPDDRVLLGGGFIVTGGLLILVMT